MSARRDNLAAVTPRIDAGSRRTLCRVTLRSFGMALVIFWPWFAGLRPLGTALDTMMAFAAGASFFCGMLAIVLREKFGRDSLNHWDEAMFYTAIARLAHLMQS